jgi:hypothetical protein
MKLCRCNGVRARLVTSLCDGDGPRWLAFVPANVVEAKTTLKGLPDCLAFSRSCKALRRTVRLASYTARNAQRATNSGGGMLGE